MDRDAKANVTTVRVSTCTCLRAGSPTLVVLLHHDWNQTALSGRVHLSSVHCHGISFCTLQGGQKKSGQTRRRPESRDWSISGHTMILLMHSSNEAPFSHSMVVTSPSMLLMLHSSHFFVSVGPTAHHLMGVGTVVSTCSGRQGVCVQPRRAMNLLIWPFDSIRRKKIGKRIEIREECDTSLEGTDNTHVSGTQVQEGIHVWWQLHQPFG